MNRGRSMNSRAKIVQNKLLKELEKQEKLREEILANAAKKKAAFELWLKESLSESEREKDNG